MSYTTLVQFMNEWNWLLSGLSAGAFAVFFNWLLNRKRVENNQKSLISLVIIELHMNCLRTNNCIKSLSTENRILKPFITRHEWNNARQTLTYVLPPDTITDIEFAYQCYQELEERLLRPNIDDIGKLADSYHGTLAFTQNAITHLNKEIGTNFELPSPIDLTQL